MLLPSAVTVPETDGAPLVKGALCQLANPWRTHRQQHCVEEGR